MENWIGGMLESWHYSITPILHPFVKFLHQLRLFDFGGCGHQWRAIGGFGILENLAFIIADHDTVGVAAEDVIGIHRHFPSTAGRIDDELRHSIAGSVTTQLLHYLKPL